jgi:hypothetical protein
MTLKVFDESGRCVVFIESRTAATPLEILRRAYDSERALALALGEIPGRQRADGSSEEQ